MIDEMTLAEASEIFGYWAEAPPPHLLLQAIARLLGWSPAPPPAPGPATFDDIAAAPPPGLALVRGADPAMPAPILDPEILRARNRAAAAKNSPSPASLRSAPSPRQAGRGNKDAALQLLSLSPLAGRGPE